MGKKQHRPGTPDNHIFGAERHGGHQSGGAAPTIKQRQDAQTPIDCAPSVTPTGMLAFTSQHAIAVCGDLMKSNTIPSPAVGLQRLPPVVEDLAVSAPGLHAARAATDQGNVQQPCASWLDQT